MVALALGLLFETSIGLAIGVGVGVKSWVL